jgi:hypothetical protein
VGFYPHHVPNDREEKVSTSPPWSKPMALIPIVGISSSPVSLELLPDQRELQMARAKWMCERFAVPTDTFLGFLLALVKDADDWGATRHVRHVQSEHAAP